MSFTAANSITDLTFALRNDPGFFGLDDISLFDNTTSTAVTVMNPGFEAGLTGWTADNIYGAAFSGVVAGANCGGVGVGPHTGTSEWCDGSVQAYDAIDQNIATKVGDNYTISFWLNSGDATGTYPVPANFQQFSTNGDVTDQNGNGIDLLVYAQSGLPAPNTPEPASMMLVAAGLLAVGVLRRRHTN